MRRSGRRNSTRNLNSAIRVAKAVLSECEQTKHIDLLTLWVLLLLARVTAAARGVQLLTRHRCSSEALPLLRAQFDATIDIAYILLPSNEPRHLRRLFKLEFGEDIDIETKAKAQLTTLALPCFLSRYPNNLRGYNFYRKVSFDPLFNSSKRDRRLRPKHLKRWRYIKTDEKLKALSGKRDHFVRFITSEVGNAFVHSRPLAFNHYFRRVNKGIRFITGDTMVPITPAYLRHLASAYLLAACKQVADDYSLRVVERIDYVGRMIAPKSAVFKERSGG